MTFEQAFNELKEYAAPEKAQHSARFFKTNPGEYGEGDKFLGITVPDQRKIAKKFKDMPLTEVEKLFRSEYHESRLTAVMLLVYRIEKRDQNEVDEVADFYLKNIEYVNNWDIVDSSCRFILGRFLENKDRDLLYELARSENLWERRIAIITCYHFIKRNDFKDVFQISKILLLDTHDLIHKAVGWMLREVGGQDEVAEEEFLLENKQYKKMPRTMLRYAIEKFDKEKRKRYLNGSA